MSHKYHCPECGSAAKIRSYSKIDDYVNCRCLSCNHRFAAGVSSPESTRELVPKRTIPSCRCPSCSGDTKTYCRKELFVYKQCLACELKFRMDFDGKILSGKVLKKSHKDPEAAKQPKGPSRPGRVMAQTGSGKPRLTNFKPITIKKQDWFSGIVNQG